MKILMISVHFTLPGDTIPLGGVQKHISKITEEFIKRNHQVEWAYSGEAKKKFFFFKPDIVIAHDFCSFYENCPVPQITVFHGWEGQVPPNPSVIQRRKEVELLSTKTICIGEYIRKWYGQNPDLVLYGGTEKAEIILPPRKYKACYIGRLEKDLSPDLFIEAVRLADNNYSLEILGDGTLRPELEKLADDLFLDVNFRGFVNNVDDYIKDSDIIFASGYLSILEAYANQRPVISVCDNLLKEDYLQLMPLSPFVCKTSGQVARMMDYLYLRGSGENLKMNYDFAIANTWDRVVDKYEKLIREVI